MEILRTLPLPKIARLLLCLGAAAALTAPITAQETQQKPQINGFAAWSYGRTDGNEYLLGTEDGEYDHLDFALTIFAQPSERLTVHGQVFWQLEGEERETELDFAFAEWRFSRAARFRIGKVRFPFGIYAEVFDVGTVRPFLFLPQGIYGPAGFVAEGYLGVGLTGEVGGGQGWEIAYDVYAGELQIPFEEPFLRPPEGSAEEEGEETENVGDLLGGRLTVQSPVDGLSFGLSAFSGTEEEVEEGGGDRLSVVGLHLEYLSDKWWWRTEYAWLEDTNNGLKTVSAYGELAYRMSPHWQLAGRYDWSDSELEEADATVAPSLLEHEDRAVALSYWFTGNLVLRLELHQVEGNRFAQPDNLDDAIAAGTLERDTRLIQFGAQFSF